MTNHPNRGKLSRNALELIAKLSAGGVCLDHREQQEANKLCRAAATFRRLQEERCNGPTDWSGRGGTLSPDGWQAWETSLNQREERAKRQIGLAAMSMPAERGVRFQGDPRGITVKLVLSKRLEHLHDAFDREGLCVPGS